MRPSGSLNGECPLLAEPGIHCLTIRAYRFWNGEIDSQEVEDFLDMTAGPNGWLMTTIWMFEPEPQIIRPGFASVPVLCPGDVATRLTLTDCEDRPQRVFGDYVVGAVELAGWRSIAVQADERSGGRFPWEMAKIAHHA